MCIATSIFLGERVCSLHGSRAGVALSGRRRQRAPKYRFRFDAARSFQQRSPYTIRCIASNGEPPIFKPFGDTDMECCSPRCRHSFGGEEMQVSRNCFALSFLTTLASCGGGGNDLQSASPAPFQSAVAVTAAATAVAKAEPTAIAPSRAAAIVISAQPQSVVVAAGQAATFAVVASGSRQLMYQWYLDNVPIANATSAVYTTRPLDIGDTDSVFSVVVSDGLSRMASAGATATVRPRGFVVSAPVIVSQPRRQTVAPGQSATFMAAVECSEVPAYQWRLNGVPIPKATGVSYTTSPATPADNGDRYSVQVSSPGGSALSADAVLSVISPVGVAGAKSK